VNGVSESKVFRDFLVQCVF